MPDSIQNTPPMPDLNSIGSWSKSDYELLTADFVSKMTADQIHAMSHTSWMPDATAAGFTPEMVASINISMSWFAPGWFNHLSTEALHGLTQKQMNELTTNTLCGLDNAHLGAFTPDQVANIQVNFYWFTPDFLNSLNQQAFAAITSAHLNEIPRGNFGALSHAQLSSITAENLKDLKDSHLWVLNAGQVNAISHLDAFSSAQFGLLNISELSVSTLKNLTKNSYSALTAGQLDGISNDKFAVLNLSELSTSTIGAMSQAVYQKLTPEQIATLSSEQIHAMAHTSWISDATASAFTPEQIQSINIGMNWFSAGWLNNLSLETLQAMTPVQAGQISTTTLAALDSEHLHAFTAEQIGGMNNFGGLSSAQFGLLDLFGMTTSVIGNFSRTEYDGLTANQITGLSTEQIQAIKHVEWLPVGVISEFTAEQTAALGNKLAQLTAEQVVAMNSLQELTSAQFGLLNISGLPVSVIANLTSTEYAGLSAKQISALSAEQINALQHVDLLSVAAVSGFTAVQMPALNDSVLSHLSADQVAAITHLSALNSQQFGLLNISHLSESAINGLSKTEYEGLTALQVATLSPVQIQAMYHPSWMSDATASAFTPEQVQNISIGMNWFSAGWLNNLSIETLQAMTPVQANQISTTTLAALDNEHLYSLSAEQIGGMNNFGGLSSAQFGLLDLSGMTTSVIGNFSRTEYDGLTANQITGLSTEQIQAIKHVEWLPVGVISEFTAVQTAALGNKLAQLTAEQVVAMNSLQELTSAQFGLLNISGLPVSVIANLTSTEYAGLSAKQTAALSAEQINALQYVDLLSVAAVSGFTAAQMPALSDNVLSHLSAQQVAAITHLSALNSQQFGLLNISQLSESAINGLSKTEYEGLTALQVATLSPAQIKAMYHPSWMSDATASAFTPEQVQNISIGMNWFSAGWLNNLSLESFQAMTPVQAGQISSATLAALDNEHLQSLSAEQIGGMNNFGGLSSAQFGLLDLSKMQTSVFSYLSDTEYKGLTANQIATFSAEQINAMGHAAWMTDDAASGFTPDQIKNCTQNFYWFSPGWFNNLTTEAFHAIKPEQMGQVYLDAFNGLDAERRAQLTADQVGGIIYNFYFFSSDWFNSLSPDAMKGITADQFTHIQTDNFKHWDNNHLAALTAAQVAFAPHLNALTSDQFGYLNISELPVSSIKQLSKTEYQGLTAQQIASLSAEQIQGLQHLSWISAAATQGFTTAQMQAFGNDLSGFSSTFLNNLSLDAMSALTPSQLKTLTPVAFIGLEYRHFLALNNFSDLIDMVSSFTSDQLLTLSPMLSIEQQGLLSQGQQALINKSVDTGFSLVDSVHDPILKTSMHNAVTNDSSLFSFTTIESILKDLASQLTGDLNANQYNDIKYYVQQVGNVCGTDSAVYSLLSGLMGTNGASVYWSATGDGERIGSLSEGSSATQFNQLISTWFDGANDPKSSSSDHVDGRPLFAKGGPSINDITQGYIGDCSLLSALQAVVETAPDFIKSMIVQNPNDTYSVRFFNKGVAQWVTVDGNAYSSGTNSATSSWAAIVERANVDFEATYLNEVNAYSSLPGGYDKLGEITGDTYTTFRAVYTPEEKWNTTDFDILKTAVLNGQPVQLSSWDSSVNADTGQTNLVGGHAFAIIGFDDVTNDFILTNPWGAFRTDGVQGTFEASMDQMWQKGNYNTGIAIVNSTGASDAAGQLVHAMAAMNTSPSAALTTAALPVNVNNGTLAASHA